MPRMLDEVLSITGEYCYSLGDIGTKVVYCNDYTRSSYYGLADYIVSSVIATSAVVLVPRPLSRG